ncbi:MAG: TolB family protein [Dehalococcoidia bacterium]
MNRRVVLIASICALTVLLVACRSDIDEPEGTSPTAEAELTATSHRVVVATATPAPLAPAGIALFDVRSGSRSMIPATQPQASAEFGPGDLITVFDAPALKTYDFGGREVTPPVVNAHTFTCEVINGSAVVIGLTYPGVPSCGPGVSPDISGTWMLYSVPAADVSMDGRTFSTWDQWVLNRHTDERRLLQSGLVHCGGCDGRFGPLWSHDGRFVVFSELVQQGRIFLSDLEGGTTRLLSRGSTESSVRPSWTPDNRLVHRASSGEAVLEDAVSGSRMTLTALRWPACLDSSGSYIVGTSAGGSNVSVYSVVEQRVVATLAGTFETNGNGYPMPCPEPPPVQRQNDTFVTVLAGATDCPGVAIYRESARVACIDLPIAGAGVKENLRQDARTVLSSNGKAVAIARLTELAARYPARQGSHPATPRRLRR